MANSTRLSQALQQGLRRLVKGHSPSTSAYRVFDLVLARRISLSPSLTRLVFTGPDVAQMCTLAPDQRVKLFFPAPDGSLPSLPNELHWQPAQWQRRASAETGRGGHRHAHLVGTGQHTPQRIPCLGGGRVGDRDGYPPVLDQGTRIAARLPDADGVLAGRADIRLMQ